MYNQSVELFARAGQSIPGGVNSPVRAFRSVGGTPLFIKRAEGAYLYDEDNNRYIDYINSWGPMIKGHAWQPVIDALKDQLQYSLSFGAPTRLEIEMAELIKSMVPGIDLVRMVNSGTEACMSALRLARGYTGRNKLIKFEGCYHGHADSFLVDAGSGVATLNIQKVPGVTSAIANDSITVPYNDIEAVKSAVAAHKGEIAAIIVEPVAGNMGCIIPAADFLQSLRTICTEEGIVFILDEVMTGFRLAPGGAQEKCQVEADLVTFGKIIGGGLPVGAFAGKQHIMEHIAPLGKVYQAGTLSGNPLAMRAGYCMLHALKSDSAIYQRLEDKTRHLAAGLKEIFTASGIPVQVNQLGSMMSVHFSDEPVTDFASAKKADVQRFSRYFHHSLNDGIYLPPSAFESWFISDALSDADIEYTLQSASRFAMEKKA